MKSQSNTKMIYCSASAIQYTARQLVKFEMVPDSTRATRTPSISPETTTERAAARREGGARSPTSGSMSCGVTVVMATMNDIAVKVLRSFVRQRINLDGLFSCQNTRSRNTNQHTTLSL